MVESFLWRDENGHHDVYSSAALQNVVHVLHCHKRKKKDYPGSKV